MSEEKAKPKSVFDYGYEDLTGPDSHRARMKVKLVIGGIHLAALAGVFAVVAAADNLGTDTPQPLPAPAPAAFSVA